MAIGFKALSPNVQIQSLLSIGCTVMLQNDRFQFQIQALVQAMFQSGLHHAETLSFGLHAMQLIKPLTLSLPQGLPRKSF